MLGKLARWLRLLGFDTFYSNRAEDAFLKELVRREERILLTRDSPLHWSLDAGRSYLVKTQELAGQLHEVGQRFRLDRFPAVPRCTICNGELRSIAKAEVENLVPPFVFKTQQEFNRCLACAKIYWPGTHWQRIRGFAGLVQEGKTE